jgi:adenylate cyclase
VVPEAIKRKLTTILAADVEGYSRLMSVDEETTLTILKSCREVIDGLIGKHHGRIFGTAGDGLIAEFDSTVEAVRCAIAIQEELKTRNAELSADTQMRFRIGVNVGDVMVEGDNLYGDGVNIAARLESISDAGGVCISGSTFDLVKGKLPVGFDDIGPQQVKNIAAPVRVYRVTLDRALASPHTASSPRDTPSIAVLPFVNMSGDPEQEYFSDGMAEDLITDLSKISGLLVIARNSSFAFKGRTVDVKDIAGKLGVKHVLEGSVRKMGSRLRVNAQLINAADGGHIWAERYDGDMQDIFQFQDDIREQIVSALRVSLSPTDQSLTERKPTESVQAYDLFLKGRAHCYRYGLEDILEAQKCFEEAIEIDPNFADAYGYLSYCYWNAWLRLLPGYDDGLERANELAERGVALDGTSAIALARLGWVQTFLRRYDQAIANLEKALALAPNNAEVNAIFAQVLNFWGAPERGRQLQERAFSIDSFAPPHWEWHIGLSHFLLRHYDQAIASLNRAVPRSAIAYSLLACTYVEMNRLDDANAAVKKQLELLPRHTVKWFARVPPFRLAEVRARILDGLRTAGMPEEQP